MVALSAVAVGGSPADPPIATDPRFRTPAKRGQIRLICSPRRIRPIYDWFIEGFDTPDLQDAKTLLDRLG